MTPTTSERELLARIRDLLFRADPGCLGDGMTPAGQPYPIRDEVMDAITAALTRQEAQQEAQGAVDTQPAPVDVRVPMSRIIELLAQLVNAPQTDDEFDADVIRRDVVMEKVTQLRMAWDELSKAQRALLDGQPAVVVIDDAMVERAFVAGAKKYAELTGGLWDEPDEHDLAATRAALQAALGGGGGRG